MKKVLLLLLCLCLLIPSVAFAVTDSTTDSAADKVPALQPDDYDEDGNPIYYINVSPEEWERTYLEHPYFQNISQNGKASFVLRDPQATRVLCSNCNRNSVSLLQKWTNMSVVVVACPGASGVTDIRYAYTWWYADFCSFCGMLTEWQWLSNQYSWNWAMDCESREKPYKIYVGHSIQEGYGFHECYSISDDGIVHGFNCSCSPSVSHMPPLE